jgi:hypothetical protein
MRLDCHFVLKHLRAPTDFAGRISAADDIFSGLAPWVLSAGARAKAGLSAPSIPDARGSVVALCVWTGEMKGPVEQKVLAPAFALPLLWVERKSDSPRLPEGFAAVADGVRQALEIHDWGLDLAEDLDGLDLSGFAFDSASAWASLAAGLYLAANGGTPRTDVFATGVWNGKGVESVDGIEYKIEAVLDLVAEKKPTLFVPSANYDQADKHAAERADIVAFPPGESIAYKSLREGLLVMLAVPPATTDSLEARCAYANQDFLMAAFAKRREYYRGNLVLDLAARIAEKRKGEPRVDRLVLGLSLSWELAVLLIAAIRPRQALLLCTVESNNHIAAVKDKLTHDCTIEPPVLLTRDGEEKACEEVAKWLSPLGSDCCRPTTAVEITSGTKEMTTVLVIAAQRAKAQLLYLSHKTSGTTPL